MATSWSSAWARRTCEGVRKGEIINIDATVECIHAAVADAEESAGVEIHNVYASVSGGQIDEPRRT